MKSIKGLGITAAIIVSFFIIGGCSAPEQNTATEKKPAFEKPSYEAANKSWDYNVIEPKDIPMDNNNYISYKTKQSSGGYVKEDGIYSYGNIIGLIGDNTIFYEDDERAQILAKELLEDNKNEKYDIMEYSVQSLYGTDDMFIIYLFDKKGEAVLKDKFKMDFGKGPYAILPRVESN